MQPTMGAVPIDGKPIDAKATGDVLLQVGRQALGMEEGKGPLPWATIQDLLNEEWGKRAKEYGGGKAFPEFWEDALKRGGVWRQSTPAPAALRRDARISQDALKLAGDGSHTLIVYPSGRFFDGRDADKSWLQETPDPVTQVAWDVWVEVSPETAQQMGLERGDLVKLTSPNGSIELPAYPYEFLHPGIVGRGTNSRAPTPRALVRPAPPIPFPTPS
jgi:molybdopterin-containing oxidoreductase family iron-sulfur binding subunit